MQLVIQSLIDCTKVTEGTLTWAEARRDAVVGLTEVCQTLGIGSGLERYVGEMRTALLECLSEYTVDMRGDIGAWVREASMTGSFLDIDCIHAALYEIKNANLYFFTKLSTV